MSETIWHGDALIRPGLLAFSGSIGPTGTHAHHAVQVMLSQTEMVVADESGRSHCGRQVIVAADAAHRIEHGTEFGIAVFLEPESAAGRTAERRCRTYGWTAGPPLSAEILRPDRLLSDYITELLAGLTPDLAPLARHQSVTAALDVIPGMLSHGPVRTSDVARRVGLSTTRLTHLFSAQVGLPLRRYVLWTRISTAIARVAAGDDLTAAAHAAGFSDSAHLTRTCRETFGLPPSALTRNIHLGAG
ncbi:helix-turn-helix transcriptional regulator [Nocardia suismassiliense]|uniref:helix-turn-helix transcriptional regulator n=1 Tax=Nocardia suismassiliense TaxID=2077092 RepID=UPI001F34D5C3|nr:helix-turn-helix transcriptional regulator [Nocardia suismassiliense]